MISEKAASDLGVGSATRSRSPTPGARVRLHRGDGRCGSSGLHPDPFRTFAYMDPSVARAHRFPGIANQVSITPEPGCTRTGSRERSFGSQRSHRSNRRPRRPQFVRERLDDFIGVLRLIEGFALALALLIAFNSSAISLDERRRENATMLAFGVTTRRAVLLAVARA